MSVFRLANKSRILFTDIKSYNKICTVLFSNSNGLTTDSSANTKKSGGFADTFEKFKTLDSESPQTFASLLRNSQFIDVSNFLGVNEVKHFFRG